ncbi:hypothetical protein MUK42_28522 [Musa troglodytarum]|uniref:Uncharacterized protein n=1 Tax=Musa troglodytarum TaxID=320322 RepID=A0A9E7F5C7_9LILI|nr:hypothetical protein MUK42_28522 [Musa troglodytarum]
MRRPQAPQFPLFLSVTCSLDGYAKLLPLPCSLLPTAFLLLLPIRSPRGVLRMAERPCYVLRRWRRLRHYGRGLWLRQPLRPGLRNRHRRPQHRALQQRAQLRRLLRDAVRRRSPVVPPGLHRRHRHQLLPPQLRPPRRQRRLVQPSAAALRPRRARLPPHRSVPRRHRPRLLPQGALREEGRHKVHRQRPLLLQPGAAHQRRRGRRRARGVHQGVQDRVAEHVAQLGPELAEQLLPRRAEPLLPGDDQRREDGHRLQRRAHRVAVRADLRGRAVVETSLLREGRRGRLLLSAEALAWWIAEVASLAPAEAYIHR